MSTAALGASVGAPPAPQRWGEQEGALPAAPVPEMRVAPPDFGGSGGPRPSVVFILVDQWRAQATGYAGDTNAHTPTLDRLATESVNFVNASSGCSVCCPYRGSLLTGQYPLTHGVFVNDVNLKNHGDSLAQVFTRGEYDTAYIGKWHLYGSPDGKYGRRHAYVPKEERHGFDYWKAFECSHDYNHSPYFAGEDQTLKYWEGYDALAQSRDACRYIQEHAGAARPFFLLLAVAPPHDPYHTAPEEYRAMYVEKKIELRPNVPEACREKAVESLRGYYAHIAALDHCVQLVLDALDQAGIAEETLLVFASDHGDMHGSQGLTFKTNPWDESIRVPFLLRYPALLGRNGRELPTPIDAPDILPTLLGLCGLPIPQTVQGTDYSPVITGEAAPDPEAAALIQVPVAFGMMRQQGLPEHRGLRTARYTYARSIHGPWLLYDNEQDPYQMHNRCNNPRYRTLQEKLERQLQARLAAVGDEFLPGPEYTERFGCEHYREVQVQPGSYRNPFE